MDRAAGLSALSSGAVGQRPPWAERLHWVAGTPVLAWQSEHPWLALSSAVHGGGLGERRWVINASVEKGYDRPDPDRHVTEMADEIGLTGPGVGLLTAVDVRLAVLGADSGVVVSATTGIGLHPTWAASPAPAVASPEPGTINTICWLPVRLSESALVNAVMTVTEAKAQVLRQAGVPGTGTPTDSVVLLCPTTGPAERYGGPRSSVGSALARAAHAAVEAGLRLLTTGGYARSEWPSRG
ncbi:Adenosylcobinamide amidohydrolase [Goodfellowiella coeruleoviolacea]|uniref:Adenosylcobinamide amidohydrolase n=1 Tax=Goodfellowiella coeruleoviolacea TaxID=334858 RepID=A0AAE3KJ76_9PSEU|nr:Adenosylcobinamide amidohydrolase [Goodfellowiella coeruleoviolacea]